MADRIGFAGNNMVVPDDIHTMLEHLSTIYTKRAAAFIGLDVELVDLKDSTLLAAHASMSISGPSMCPLAAPPEPIQPGFDGKNNMRLECLHSPKHCWSLNGQKQSC